MPIHVKHLEDNGVILKGEGVVTFDDLRNANNIIYANDKRIKETTYQLVDLSAIDRVELSNNEIERLAQQDQLAFKVNPDMRIAIVGTKDLTYGLSRVWEVFACELYSQQVCEVFRDLEAAREWVHVNK